jgi:hypothetical protein
MDRRYLACFAVLCFPLLGIAQSKSGETLTGLALREDCATVGHAHQSADEYASANRCLFYISGVVDGYQAGDGVPRICIPDGATQGEMALVVSKYLNRYPERLHNTPVSLVIDALATVYPCNASLPDK